MDAHADPRAAREITLTLTGMTCEACARSIDTSLREVAGVLESRTEFSAGRVTVVASLEVESNTLARVVERAGYTVTGRREGEDRRSPASMKPVAGSRDSDVSRRPRPVASGIDVCVDDLASRRGARAT